jgi:hypothetical protein
MMAADLPCMATRVSSHDALEILAGDCREQRLAVSFDPIDDAKFGARRYVRLEPCLALGQWLRTKVVAIRFEHVED